MKLFFISILFALSPISSQAAEIVFVNHTRGEAKIAELFNVCQGFLIESGKPVILKNGESISIKVLTVMQHYKICGSGVCSETAIQMKDDISYEVEMTRDGSLIDGRIKPDQWGGPSNACPAI